mmetsp:Transcript_49216/g.96248  ORF Transcript_49216/g.96248 Transcript_49216/m.96248 type:complete len:167 (-) Transcript_49216:2-502(-)
MKAISCPQTRRNYQAVFAAVNQELGVNENIQQKTDSRYTAGHSLIAAMAYTVAVAVTHYSIGEPFMITSMDDSTLFAFQGISKETSKFYLVEKNGSSARSNCVLWCGGGGPQLLTITNDSSLQNDEVFKVLSVKHNPGRTAVEQGCEICSVFRSVNKYIKKTTAED